MQSPTVNDNGSENTDSIGEQKGKAAGKLTVNERAVKGVSEDDEVQEVVKKVKVTSDYFNTIANADEEPNLIKAIIDENVKAVDGSRVRLRLLDDIEINEVVVPKGTYIYALIEETKSLCYQFESIVTNSSLSFKDIAFLEINQELADILKLSELGDVDWKAMLDNFSNIGDNFTKESLQEDLDNLYAMGVNLASAGAGNLINSILGESNFNGSILDKAISVMEIAENAQNLYDGISTNAGATILSFIGGEEGLANLFNLSNYNVTSWITDYAREGMGQYYTQRWYIYRVDRGSVKLCDYYPPTDDNSILYGDHWYRISTSDPNYWPTSSEREAALQNSENHAGWSRSRVQQLNNSNDGFYYSINYYSSAYILSKVAYLRASLICSPMQPNLGIIRKSSTRMSLTPIP